MPGALFEYVPPARGKDRFAWVSGRVRELLEVEPEALQENSELLWSMVDPEDRVRLAQAVREAARAGAPLHARFRIVTPSGRHKWLETHSLPEPAPHGRYRRWDGILTDITAQHELHAATAADRAVFRRMSEESPDLITRVGRDGRFVYANPAFLSVGLRPEELIGRTAGEVGLAAGPASAWERALDRAFGGEIARCELSQGGRRYEVLLVPERSGEGQLESVLTIGRDITERADAERELREANRRKGEFLALLSHELRNPLAPIRNALYILGRVEPGSEPSRRALAVMERQIGQLARLVDDLLDVSRIERNRIQLQRQQLELNDLVLRTAEDHRSTFETAGVSLSVNTAGEALPVEGDPTRLAQVVANLLHNAAKFTGPGGETRVEVSRAPRGFARVVVRDTGIGMDRQTISRLFQPFAQDEAARVRSRGGLGLGLALVRGLVASHGGQVEARSAGPGLGSEFEVRLPLREDADAERRTPPRERRRRRVLIIEDNVDAATTLREVLEIEGHEVDVAHGGAEGVARARDRRPEIVLCDIGLPGMDGYEVARAIRGHPGLRDVHLVAVSGYALPEDVRRAREAGFEQHLPKPPSLEQLERTIESIP
ncbi:MAG TPA: ATP-binding protein [Anaeromyxobacter sp.]|nr:ATP-binding protein [Anaeromyxobacter sp.]